MLRDKVGRRGGPAWAFLLPVCALLASCHHRTGSPPPGNIGPPPLPLAGVTLIIDPGHGGADSGAVRYGDCEAALTYRTAAEVAHDVRLAGGQVVYTVRSQMLAPDLAIYEPPPKRPLDAVLALNGQPLRPRRDGAPEPLWQRAAVAAHLWRACAPPARRMLFFLSLHYDDSHSPLVHGALVCVDKREAHIPLFAKTLDALLNARGLTRRDSWHGLRGVSGRRLGVLDPRYNPVPERLLLEVATISNPDNSVHAADPLWRQMIAAKVTAALTATVREERTRAEIAVQ